MTEQDRRMASLRALKASGRLDCATNVMTEFDRRESESLRTRASFIDDSFYLDRVRFHSDAGRSLRVAQMAAYADWVERGQS